jgi:hypothetical protein
MTGEVHAPAASEIAVINLIIILLSLRAQMADYSHKSD